MITTPLNQITDGNGNVSNTMLIWIEAITSRQIISGTGTPEGNIEAMQFSLYMDETGTAGNILYIKRDADIAGDKSKGWILV